MSTVIAFPRQLRLVSDLSEAAILRRARLAALAGGLGASRMAEAEALAQRLLNSGAAPAAVIRATGNWARQQQPQVPA